MRETSNSKRNFLPLLLFLGFLNLFLYQQFGRTAFAFISVGFALFFLASKRGKTNLKNQKTPLTLFVFITILAVSLVTRSYPFVTALAVVAIKLSLALLLYLLVTKLPFIRSLFELVTVPFRLVAAYLKAGLASLVNLTSQEKKTTTPSKRNPVTPLIIGFLVALPILFMLVNLLSRGDPAFNRFIQNLFNFTLPEHLVGRLLWTGTFFLILYPLTRLSLNKDILPLIKKPFKEDTAKTASVITGLVGATLTLFLVVQAPYVFVNVPQETDLSQFGIKTYSEYTTNGFTELLLAGFLVYTVIWAGLIVMRYTTSHESLKKIQLITLAAFAILILSIFRRILLYENYHGLSLIRFYGGLFLVWLTSITTTLAARHFKHLVWIRWETAFTAAILLFAVFGNAENYIATHNPPTVNNNIDYVYLSRLSPDGTSGWLRATNHAQQTLTENLEDDNLIDRDERRELAYSGMSIAELINHSIYLTTKYGSESEIKSLYHKFALFQEERIGQTINTLENQLSSITDTKERAKTEGWINAARATNERFRSIADTIRKASFEEWTKTTSLSNTWGFFPRPYNGLSDCFEPFCIGLFQEVRNDRGRFPSRIQENTDTLDRLFTFNLSEYRAHQFLKNQIPLEKLLNLEARYHDLYLQVTQQPPSERDYEQDISLNTPLL